MTHRQVLELAVERHTGGDVAGARELFERVASEDPSNPAAIFGIGQLEMQAGKLQQAVAAYRRAAELVPTSAQVHFSLGLALQTTGDPADAIAAHRQALRLDPQFAAALSNLGAALLAVGQTDNAIEPLESAARIEPTVASHCINLGSALSRQRRFAEAEAVLRKAIELDPRSAQASYNLGVALGGKGERSAAADAYRQATVLNPKFADAHANLGAVLQEMGDAGGALDAFHAAIKADPACLAAYNNAGCAFRSMGNLDDAETVLRQALSRGLVSSALYSNLGNVLKDAGLLDEAIECYRKAIELNPDDTGAHGNLCYSLSFLATDGREILDECRRFNQRHALPVFHSLPLAERVKPSDSRRLRIGYVSGDFRDHCQTLFTLPLLSHHDRGEFEIYCYSSVQRPDDYTRRLMPLADVWRDVRFLDDAALAQRIRDDQIEVLVDLGMHMGTGRPMVFGRSPALVQVAWLAYPGTTGIDAIQYRLTDWQLDPQGSDNQYSEHSIRLPHTFWCYDPLADVPINPLPALSIGTVTFGCLNNPCKLTDRTLSMWAAVLREVGASRLIVLAPPGRFRQRLADRLAAQGIDLTRVTFHSYRARPEYLQTYHDIDIGLDTFPYNGHTTSLDSFWMGVPVVTRVGQTAVGRGGLSQLHNLGLPELAGDDDAQFVRIAVDLARDLPRLNQLRQSLRSRMERSPLMDAPTFARNIEAAYRWMGAQNPRAKADR
jgi:predicted O-linked N-acetylglucosamine transferase (SPINDLY family)